MSDLVLLSGGMDSAVCLAIAATEGTPAALFVDYEQPAAAEELSAARALSGRFKAELAVTVVRGLPPVGLLATSDPSDARWRRRNAYVPARNLALISIAASHALAGGHRTISIGACADDDYLDTSNAFLVAANALLGIIAEQQTSLIAPLRDIGKRSVHRLALEHGIQGGDTWSCHYPDSGNPCRKCSACLARRFLGSDD